MARHHFVPQFLLRQWSGNGRFVAYFWEAAAKKVIENTKASVASACQIEDLNTFFGVTQTDRDFPETGFFTPLIDTPAAEAHAKLMNGGLTSLSDNDRSAWARFLISLGVRTPETLREMGPAEARKAMEIAEAAVKGPPEEERIVTNLIQQHMKRLERNFPLGVAMDLSMDENKISILLQMEWWLRHWDRDALIIGDRPLLAYPLMPFPCGMPLDNPSCLIALPIAPNVVFLASPNLKTRSKTRAKPLGAIAHSLNEETIRRCATTVFAADASKSDFISPRIEGKAKGTWQPRL